MASAICTPGPGFRCSCWGGGGGNIANATCTWSPPLFRFNGGVGGGGNLKIEICTWSPLSIRLGGGE